MLVSAAHPKILHFSFLIYNKYFLLLKYFDFFLYIPFSILDHFQAFKKGHEPQCIRAEGRGGGLSGA